MKKHLVSIMYEVYGQYIPFVGFVTGKEIDGKVYISPDRIFWKAFGFELPKYSKYIVGY